MYDNLPQLSKATRQLIGKEVDRFSKLPESEAQNQLEEEIAQLEKINQWVAKGVSFVPYCVEQVDESTSDAPDEVRAFWGTMGPYIRVHVLKATLILLQAIDKELWIRDMEGKVKDVKEAVR